MHPVTEALIRELQLSPHPEGGYFRRVYESARRTEVNGIERRDNDGKPWAVSVQVME